MLKNDKYFLATFFAKGGGGVGVDGVVGVGGGGAEQIVQGLRRDKGQKAYIYILART